MPSVGKSVEELRIFDEDGSFRVIYYSRRAEAVYVLHAFQKKSEATSKRDLDLARVRLTKLAKD